MITQTCHVTWNEMPLYAYSEILDDLRCGLSIIYIICLQIPKTELRRLISRPELTRCELLLLLLKLVHLVSLNTWEAFFHTTSQVLVPHYPGMMSVDWTEWSTWTSAVPRTLAVLPTRCFSFHCHTLPDVFLRFEWIRMRSPLHLWCVRSCYHGLSILIDPGWRSTGQQNWHSEQDCSNNRQNGYCFFDVISCHFHDIVKPLNKLMTGGDLSSKYSLISTLQDSDISLYFSVSKFVGLSASTDELITKINCDKSVPGDTDTHHTLGACLYNFMSSVRFRGVLPAQMHAEFVLCR